MLTFLNRIYTLYKNYKVTKFNFCLNFIITKCVRFFSLLAVIVIQYMI
jgi:hypothetical protein